MENMAINCFFQAILLPKGGVMGLGVLKQKTNLEFKNDLANRFFYVIKREMVNVPKRVKKTKIDKISTKNKVF